MTTLHEIFDGISSDTVLNDGATSRTKADIRSDMYGEDELDAEYALDYTRDGRITITKINDDGYLASIPTWIEDTREDA